MGDDGNVRDLRARLAQQKKPDLDEPVKTAAAAVAPEISELLGAFFAPGAFGYRVTKGEFAGKPCVFVVFECAVGRFAFPLARDEAAVFGRMVVQQTTGIVLPEDLTT